MPDHNLRRASDPLGAHLRHEADLTCPAFSAELHERLREALACEKAMPAATGILPRVRARRWPLAAASAAAVALTVAIWFWFDARRSPNERLAAAAGDEFVKLVAISRRLPEQVSGLIDSAVSRGRWAYLDEDMQTAINALVRSLPSEVPVAGRYQQLAAAPMAEE